MEGETTKNFLKGKARHKVPVPVRTVRICSGISANKGEAVKGFRFRLCPLNLGEPARCATNRNHTMEYDIVTNVGILTHGLRPITRALRVINLYF